jgi:putative acetyltransferase
MGLTGARVDSLFLAPEVLRRGIGRRLVAHARARRGALEVDVNERNEGARRFYEACGFAVVGRSETDEAGRPYPILHMRQLA